MLFQSLRQVLLKPPALTFLRNFVTPLPSNEAPLIFSKPGRDSARLEAEGTITRPDSNRQFSLVPVFIEMSSLVHVDDPATSRPVAILAPSVFRHPIRRDILHLCVVHHLDGLRQGTAANKNRGEVRGSGAKIRPQKGSGKARLGDAQSPMLRGGGRAFAKKARDFSTKLPRKVIQMGMRVALSAKVRENGLGVVETLEWTSFKTNDLARRLQELGWDKTLFVTGLEKVPETLERSSRNIQGIDVMTASELTVYDAVKWERLVIDIPAVEFYEKTLGKPQLDQMSNLQ